MKRLTKLETLVLKALHDGNNFDDNWNQILQISDFATLPHSINRSLPIIFNVLRGQTEAQEYQRLAGYTKRNWAENVGRLNYVLPILESAHKAGIKVVVLKGMAICFLRKDFASRVMGDADLLIHKSDEEAFGKIIKELGFNASFILNCAHQGSKVTTTTDEFLDKDGNKIDIHSTADPDFLFKILWDESIPIQYEGINLNISNPVNLMLHSLSHGFEGVAQSDLMQTGLDFLMLKDDLKILDLESKAMKLGLSRELGEFLNFFELEEESQIAKSRLRRRSLKKEFGNLSRIRREREINLKMAIQVSRNRNLNRRGYFFWILLGAPRPLEEFWISKRNGFVRKSIEYSEPSKRLVLKELIAAELESQSFYEIRFGIRGRFENFSIDTNGLMFATHQLFINGKLIQRIQPNSKLLINLSDRKDEKYEISIRQPYGRCQKCTNIILEASLTLNVSNNLSGNPIS